MKRTMPAALLLLAASVPAQAADRRFTVSDFDRVQVEGPYEVVLTTGKAPLAIAIASNDALNRIAISVQGRTLRVRPDRSGWGGYPGEGQGGIRIVLATHDLRGVSVTGSGSLDVDAARAMRFDIAVSGTGSVRIGRIEADTLIAGLLGSGRIEAAGSAKMLRATIQGSGDFKAAGLTAQDAEISADTAGTIDVAVRGTAKVTSTGPGETRIAGKPACTVKALGTGRVQCGNE